MNVIIPSYNRSESLRGKDYFFMAKYCVPKSQKDKYINKVGINRVICLPDAEDGNIVKKRNWIIRNIPKPLIMIDDDVSKLVYWDNRRNGKTYLRDDLPKDLLLDVFNEFISLAEQFEVKMFGISQNTDDRVHKESEPFNLTNIILGPFQGHLEHDLNFDERVGTKDDYDMSLQQLNKYRKILRFNKFAYECNHGNNKGGIVSYRSKNKEIQYCEAIMKKWGTNIIKYNIPPKKMTDLLNANNVNIPIKGV